MSAICKQLSEIELKKGDFVYLDLLSNIIYTGTDEDEHQIPPHKDGNKKWHVEGSLSICTKPRIRKILASWEVVKEVCGEATLVCGLTLPRYLKEKCCEESNHIDNHGDADFQDIFLEAEEVGRGCLEATFPGAIIFEPLAAFG